ncbi:MAG: ribose 5-phosphate isomerase B [Syntrophaceae bacterium]|nr:ribose 5-phosphate isomerase B [Syntrophaceae bacterium]
MKIALGSDHAGFELKEDLRAYLTERQVAFLDLGTFSEAPVDYPDVAAKVAEKVCRGEVARGLLICGTGIGMSIVANRFAGVRAALCHDIYTARISREHNDANILALGGRLIGKGLAREILKTWLETEFQGGRHERRVQKISALGEKPGCGGQQPGGGR